MAFKLINNKYVEVDDNGIPIKGGKEYYYTRADTNHINAGAGTGTEYQEMIEHFLNTGQVKSFEETSFKKGKKAYDNLVNDLNNVFIKENNINQQSFSAEVQSKIAQNTDLTSTEDMFAFDNPNSTAGRLYDVYRQANQDQYEGALAESAYMEKDLNKTVGMERQALIESMREDRKKMLKSGLSQSAIANREIQGLLQGQNIATELGTGFLGERRNLNQLGRSIDSTAKTQVIDAYNSGVGNMMGGLRAAQAGDLYQQALLYSNANRKTTGTYNKFLEEQNKN